MVPLGPLIGPGQCRLVFIVPISAGCNPQNFCEVLHPIVSGTVQDSDEDHTGAAGNIGNSHKRRSRQHAGGVGAVLGSGKDPWEHLLNGLGAEQHHPGLT